jgi:hypothetical protein
MDRNLDIENFEQLLKERSEEFKMYPTKRVWYSIYNNIHPGRKWPSVAMSITLIAILLLVGFLNTKNSNTSLASTTSVQPGNVAPVNLTSSFHNPFESFSTIVNQNPVTAFANNSTLINQGNTTINNTIDALKLPVATAPVNGNYNNYQDVNNNLASANTITIFNKNELTAIAPIKNNLIAFEPIIHQPTGYFTNEKNTIDKNDAVAVKFKINGQTENTSIIENNTLVAFEDVNDTKSNAINQETKPSITNKKDVPEQQEIILSADEKSWIENYALYNRPVPKKWAGKLGWQMYIAPSVVYWQLKNSISTDLDINKEVIQHPSFGLEIGGGIIYPLFKGVKVKTGLQLNFTRYNTAAFENSHPVATTITLKTETGQPYPSARTTPYSNNDGITPTKLHNETFQISIPMGLDFKIAGTENLQWNIGATIQPTYVIGGKSYLISSDKRNYIKETSLLNRWNVNAGFETFISYKTNGYTLQFGPQFRQQLFTTNSKQYSIEEKLTNYGFKFGISKLIK